jgi:hypothetical protein
MLIGALFGEDTAFIRTFLDVHVAFSLSWLLNSCDCVFTATSWVKKKKFMTSKKNDGLSQIIRFVVFLW